MAVCGSASYFHPVPMREAFQSHEVRTGLGRAMSWVHAQHQLPSAQASTGCQGGQQTRQRKVLGPAGEQPHEQLHPCLSLSVLSCLLTPAQMT